MMLPIHYSRQWGRSLITPTSASNNLRQAIPRILWFPVHTGGKDLTFSMLLKIRVWKTYTLKSTPSPSSSWLIHGLRDEMSSSRWEGSQLFLKRWIRITATQPENFLWILTIASAFLCEDCSTKVLSNEDKICETGPEFKSPRIN